MSPDELRAWRLANALTVVEMAALLGVSRRTIQSWEAGEQRIPQRIAMLLPRIRQAEIRRQRTSRRGPQPRKEPQDA